MSGAEASRFGAVTAKAFTLFERTCGSELVD
jgi:hypothetical protein